MKILVSAFSCLPNVGSEGGVGWRWANELAKEHEVVVITDVTRQQAIQEELAIRPVANLQFVFFRPAFLSRIPLNSATAQVLYAAWQFALLPFARALHRQHKFDLAWHLTYSVFRHPSFLGFLGIPFIFGPLGGGEDAPLRLKKSIKGREKVREIVRSIVNKLALVDPFLWCAYARTTLIIASTKDTRLALPWPFRKRTLVYPNLGIDSNPANSPPIRHDNEPLRLLFVGRLLGMKGVQLAIRSISEAQQRNIPVELTIVGQGPYEAELRRVAHAEKIDGKIQWIGHMPQHELFLLYQSMHCFLFPSLHDSGGSVVIEAQSKGLPVICLDIGGPAGLVRPDSAIVVNTAGLDEKAVVLLLTDAIETLANDEARRQEMGRIAIDHVSTTMSWESRVQGVMEILAEHCREFSPSGIAIPIE